jgi:hypothetical protein
MNSEQQGKQWGQIVKKAWQDEDFKKRLLAEPTAVLKEYDLEIQPGIQVRVIENTDKIIHLTLPAKPQTGLLSEEELGHVVGGLIWSPVKLPTLGLKKVDVTSPNI